MPEITVQQAFELALQHQYAGRLPEADAICRQILAAEPRHGDALHLLGLIALEKARPDIAADLIRRAIGVSPGVAIFHYNLGNVHGGQGQLDEAISAYRRAIDLQPDFSEAHNNLGTALRGTGRVDEAIGAHERAIQCNPENAEAHSNLGVALCDRQRPGEAIAACQRALQLRPDFAPAHYNLGNALRDQGRPVEAIAAYRRVIALRPAYALAHNNLGNELEKQGRCSEAAAAYRHGIGTSPDFAPLHNNLGTLLKDLGRIGEALACTRRAVDISQDSSIHSNLLAVLQYSTESTLGGLFDAHCEYDRRHAAALTRSAPPHRNTRDPDRPLRIGMVSPHFAFHPVGHFLIRVLENLDRSQFEIIAYSDARTGDAMTARLRAATAEWRDVSGVPDERLADCIRDDRVDILFDLAGHTAGNRLPVFARKPAPIQITWLDYVGTTGLAAMDCIIGDPREIPPEAEPWYREKVLRMRDDYVCYDPPAGAPPVGPLPALAKGHVTFASFNIPAKTTPEIVRVWARILAAVPGSRLLVKNRGFDDPQTREYYGGILTAEGIARERVELRGWSPSGELLAAYNEADIALDTFPYNGGLTTCEAIWMGVPVVTCPGKTFASRHGLAHLTAAGIPETIARDLDHYAALAVNLASDLPRLAEFRAGLRARVAGSPLCDGNRFAAHFMGLLRDEWRQWALRPASDAFPSQS